MAENGTDTIPDAAEKLAHHTRRHLHLAHHTGQRAADAVSGLFGSWRFIIGYVLATLLWCGGNLVLFSFDRYPYQFYTFSVSVLAILMSAIILLAQNRQAEKDRARDDLEAREVDELHQMNQTQLEILHMLKDRFVYEPEED